MVNAYEYIFKCTLFVQLRNNATVSKGGVKLWCFRRFSSKFPKKPVKFSLSGISPIRNYSGPSKLNKKGFKVLKIQK